VVVGTRLLAAAVILGLCAACTMSPQGEIAAANQGDEDRIPGAMMAGAKNSMAKGDYASAASLFRQAHLLRPDEIEPLLGLGRALSGAGAPQEAAEAYRAALKIDPKNPEAMRGLANSLVALNQPELAIPYYEDALALTPSDYRIYMGLGVAYDLMGQHKVAQAQYQLALVHEPDDLDVLSNLGLSQALAMDLPAAIETLRKVVEKPGATARHRQNLALVYGLAGRNEEAARIARLDLDEATVRRNITYFATLRSIKDPSRRLAAIRAYQEQHRF